MYEISKDEFVKIIDTIQRHIEYDSACDDLARKYQIEFDSHETSGLGYIAMDLLDMMFDSYYPGGYGDVSYFC